MKKIIPFLALTTTGIMLTGCSYTIEKIEPADYQSNLMEFREHIDNLSTIDEENFSKIAFNKYKLSIIENDEIKLIDNNVLNSADSNNANDLTKNVVVSTASPYKVTKDVLRAIDNEKYKDGNPFLLMNELEKISKVSIPAPIKDIDKREILHKTVIEKTEIKDFVRNYLK